MLVSSEIKDDKSKAIKKIREGIVLNDVSDKTIIVTVERITQHPKYKKTIKKSKKYYAHDEKNEAKIGDRVQIIETRPLSKLKRWRLLNIVHTA